VKVFSADQVTAALSGDANRSQAQENK
jgi:hypothetical protein